LQRAINKKARQCLTFCKPSSVNQKTNQLDFIKMPDFIITSRIDNSFMELVDEILLLVNQLI
jgi:hypothetical protein